MTVAPSGIWNSNTSSGRSSKFTYYTPAENWVYTVDASTAVDPQQPGSGLPVTFELGFNYPNPFNNRTIIPYSLPERSRVSLQIYSITGQKIETLFSGWKEAGSHSIEWDGSDLASCIYYCRMAAKGKAAFTYTRKMLLIR